MSDSRTVNVDFGNCSGTLDVEPLGENRFRIASPEVGLLTEDYEFGDVIEATWDDSKESLIVEARLERGNYKSYEFCLSPGWENDQRVRKTLEAVHEHGGDWVGIFGGILIVVLPPESVYDPTNDILKTTVIADDKNDTRSEISKYHLSIENWMARGLLAAALVSLLIVTICILVSH